MQIQELAGWVAPAATMTAAVMTALNLGARVTGWGFVVFTLASTAWCVVAISTSQANLLWSNAFLLIVNLVGVWRWLGRKAKHERAGRAVAAESAEATSPTLTPLTCLPGMPVTTPDGAKVGSVIDVMMRCRDLGASYLVVSDGGVAGVGERLYGLALEEVSVTPEGVALEIDAKPLAAREPLEPERWPSKPVRTSS